MAVTTEIHAANPSLPALLIPAFCILPSAFYSEIIIRSKATVAESDPADWRAMYEVNVLGTLNVTQALLPPLIASGDGTIVVMGSTAGFVAYEGGGGYVAAKHGEHAIAATLRLELSGQPVRVIEIAPGMVRTDEFAVNRFRRRMHRVCCGI